MILPFRALGDPLPQEFDFRRGEGFVELRRRHDFVGVACSDSSEKFAFIRLSRDDRMSVVDSRFNGFSDIEPQFGFAGFLVGAVSREAFVREQGADVPAEIHLGGGDSRRRGQEG